jgi:NAD(P)-dependent dehydrogenase (short-subunit alcohol dehydrogenase family)
MTTSQAERLVLITGANRGIGFETAKQLAVRGWHVVVASRDPDSGKQAVKAIEAGGGMATQLTLDASRSESIGNAAKRFSKIAEKLDVLINNAGIYPDEGTNLLTVSRQRMADTFQTNTFGALEVTQAFLPILRRSTAGRIIHVSSGYGQLEGLSPEAPSYCLSKLALNGLTIMLSQSLAPDHIAVNSMCPGWVRTEMGGPNATRSVEEGADTAVWLADEAPHELTGKFFRDRREIAW